MKIRTVLISGVVTVALIGGIGYAAYYTMQSKKAPVEVVPVANVNTGYWGMTDSLYGTITSQVAQIVTLHEEYPIEEIYVAVGDSVREGTPLFSYDMTLPELELEMEELSLQTQELMLAKLEKDLAKLKNTNVTASLTSNDYQMTASSGSEDLLVEPQPGESSSETAGNGNTAENDSTRSSEEHAESITGSPQIQIDGIEAVESAPELNSSDGDGASESDDASENKNASKSNEASENDDASENKDASKSNEASENDDALKNKDASKNEDNGSSGQEETDVAVFEQLVSAIGGLFEEYEKELRSDEISSAIRSAVKYYRRHLADEIIGQTTDKEGNSKEVVSYKIKNEVQAELDQEQLMALEKYSQQLDLYQRRYVEMLIEEAGVLEGEKLAEAVEIIWEEYNYLATAQQEEVRNFAVFEQYKAQVEAYRKEDADSELPGETSVNSSSDQNTLQEDETGADTQDESGSGESSEDGTESGSGESSEDGTESGSGESSEDGTESGSGDSLENGTESGSGESSEDGTESGSENDSEIGTESGSESDTEESGSETESERDTESETYSEVEEDSEALSGTEQDTESESSSESESDTETEVDLSAKIEDFRTRAYMLLMEGASPTKEDYLAAIDLYQQFLAAPQADVVDLENDAKMEEYILTDEALSYLNGKGETAAQETADSYQQICFAYVRYMITRMDPKALVRTELNEAVEAYSALGLIWQSFLEQQWQEEQAAGQTVQTENNELVQTTDPEADNDDLTQTETESTEVTKVYPSLLDYLTAYDMILRIQELDLTQTKKELKSDLKELKELYLALSDTQKELVWNSDELIALLTRYGLWNIEPEPETEWDDFDDWDDWDDWDDGEYYTAEELAELIKEKEREIRECELEVREAEIAVRKQQRIVDGKVVKSTMDGTVISIGEADGSSETDYFAKIANDSGLYAKGAMNELSLEKIKVGDTISGVTMDDGISFTAVIKEISEYPEEGGSGYYGYGSENTNASYYPFYALINNSEGMEEGEAEIQLSETMVNEANAIYLELFFVRTDNNGKSYVMKQGEDGLLTKQLVETGKTVSNYAVEIVSGLSGTDRIAFPYGDDVFEGAQTKEVDMLEAAYM